MNEFQVEEINDVTAVKVTLDRATLQHAESFKAFVSEIIHSGKRKLVIDLSVVKFMDSTFLGAIVINLKRVATIGGDLRMVICECEATVVWSMFEATRMNKVFRVFDSLESAVESYN